MLDGVALLVTLGWFGPYLFIALFRGLEKAFPKYPDDEAWTFWPDIKMGLVTLVVMVFVVLLTQDAIVAAVYPLRIADISALPVPVWAKFVVSALLIDLIAYATHRISHKVGVLWRLHMAHHMDPCVKSSTGVLHHPFEFALLYVVTLALFVMLGIPKGVLLLNSVAISFHAIMVHSNLRLPPRLSRILGYVVFMPDQHRIHHSTDRDEEHSNFGQIFPFWDRLLGTYRDAPKSAGAFSMGLADIKIEKKAPLSSLLKSPFA